MIGKYYSIYCPTLYFLNIVLCVVIYYQLYVLRELLNNL